MSFLAPSLYFKYLSRHYFKNLVAILFGLSFAFATIDYFQNAPRLDVGSNYKILYIFYKWQESLGMLYPLALIFALIMTKMTLVKNNTMAAFHAFGYDKKRLLLPIFTVAAIIYGLFVALQTTSFSYAKDKAELILKKEVGSYDVNDLFFKYNDTFVYIHTLDPLAKTLRDITIFKVSGHQVRYTIAAPMATFKGDTWIAHDAIVKTHLYKEETLNRYKIEHKRQIETLEGYKPKILESLYVGKAMNILDVFQSWQLLQSQHINSDTVRYVLYEKIVTPLFALAMVIILFLKIPFHARVLNFGAVIALSLGGTFMIWGVLFGLGRMSSNGALLPEVAAIVPIVLLWVYALYLLWTDKKRLA